MRAPLTCLYAKAKLPVPQLPFGIYCPIFSERRVVVQKNPWMLSLWFLVTWFVYKVQIVGKYFLIR